MIFAPLEPARQVSDPLQRIYVYPFGPTPMLGGVSSTSGAALLWAYEQLSQGPARGLAFEECVMEALETEPGADGSLFCALSGRRTQPILE